MPKSHDFRPVALTNLAHRIGGWLHAPAFDASIASARVHAEDQTELAESFEVWILGPGPVSRGAVSIQSAAQQTKYWHHQIRRNGKATEYARSIPDSENADWEIRAVLASDLASKIERGIELIDAEPSLEKSEVKLLIVPAHGITALWMVMDDKTERLLVVDAPQAYQRVSANRIYDTIEFLKALGQETPAQGIPARLQRNSPPLPKNADPPPRR